MGFRTSKPGEVSIRLGYPISNLQPNRFARLEVTDEVSGQMILEVDLPAEQLVLLMSGATARARATVLVPRPERVGKRMELHTVRIQNHGPMVDLDAAAEATAAGYREEWDTVQISKTQGGGRLITCRRWVPVEPVTGDACWCDNEPDGLHTRMDCPLRLEQMAKG